MSKISKFFSFLQRTPPEFSKPFEDQGREISDDSEMQEESQGASIPNTGAEENKKSIEGQTFGVEYANAYGDRSLRRISVQEIKSSPGNFFYLYAFCHLRKEFRTFRSDRVLSVHDDDGVVIEPKNFFALFDLKDEFEPDSSANDKAFRNAFRHELRLLTAMGRSDGRLHAAEVAVILEFALEEAQKIDIHLNDEDIERLEKYVRRLYPTINNIDDSLSELEESSITRRKNCFHAAVRVINADGEQAAEEVEFLIEFCEALSLKLEIERE